MNEIITVKRNQEPIYNIYFEDYSMINKIIRDLALNNRKVCVVTDSNVAPHYIDRILGMINESEASLCIKHVFEAGEDSKNVDTIFGIIEDLINNHFDRKDFLIALGGGVTGDMTGFAAAIYLRGIKFIQMPTSLLAMVDSSIGGKTGVDFNGYKNMVGAFHMPSAVLINSDALLSLPKRELMSGFAEIIKHAIIADKYYFDFLKKNAESVISLDKDILNNVIYWSCKIKQGVVEKDPTEKGIRAFLNFGHTIGHAIEKYMDFALLHGECVSLGIVAAGYISKCRNLILQDTYDKIVELLRIYELPVCFADIRDYSDKDVDVLQVVDFTKSDKKADGNKIKFVLISEIGKVFIDTTVSDEEIKNALINLGE